MHILLGPRPLTVASTPLGNAVRFVLVLLPVTVFLAAGCRNPNAAPAIPSPEVEVASVVQKDVPIYSEWVATLDGYVNAQIQAQVPGYIIQQAYKEGSFVHKGQLLFQIDPRPFQTLLDQANAQLAQAQAQLGKTEMDVDPDTPLAKERAIAQSQLDNDVQANKAVNANGGAALPTIDSRGVPRCLGRSGGLPEDARIPYTGESLFQSAQDAARLSHDRYTGGATGYLELLTNETNAFSAELGLAPARLNEMLALVQLYEALGGGWQQ